MAKAEEKKGKKRAAPYVPISVLDQFFDHVKYVKTPSHVTSKLLLDYSISKGHVFALLSALKFLGLIDDGGAPTEIYKSLHMKGDEFKTNLEDILKNAYSDLFNVIDPSKDGREHIRNFFARNYKPATAERATALFLDLCGEAGIPTLDIKSKKVIKERVSHKKSESRVSSKKTSKIERPLPTVKESETEEQQGVDIRIDSKDFASMQIDQIQAFFDGLTKLLKETGKTPNGKLIWKGNDKDKEH